MTHKTQPTAHAEITAPISADLRGIGALAAPAAQQDALLLAMHLRQRAKLATAGIFDTLCMNAANVLAAQHERIAEMEAQPARECLQQSAEPDSREAQMVVIKRGADGVPTVWCDPEIVDIVRALNDGGLPTVASCSGHGEKFGGIALSDGRQLMVIPSLDEFNAAHTVLHTAPPAPAAVAVPDELIRAARQALACMDGLRQHLGRGVCSIEADALRAALAAAPAQAVAVPAPQPVATIEVQDDGNLDYETSEAGWLLPAGLHKLYAAPAQEHATQLAGPVQWRSIETAPNDGTLLRLLVEFETGNLEDDDKPQATIGHNSFANTGVDEWQFSGWSWTHDCFVQGTGRVVGWLPLLDAAAPAQAQEDARDAARWRQVLLHVGGQRNTGCQTFGLATLKPVSGNIMQGSVLEHFVKAIDAARAAQGGAA